MNYDAIHLARSVSALDKPGEMAAQENADNADAQLMRDVATGNERAMAQLLQIHGPMLQRLIGRLTAWQSDDLDDLLQETLVTAWQRAGEFRGDGSLAGWLRTIAVNKCRNHFRARDSFRRLLDLFVRRTNVTDATENYNIAKIENFQA